jgi:palmitoyl transferase
LNDKFGGWHHLKPAAISETDIMICSIYRFSSRIFAVALTSIALAGVASADDIAPSDSWYDQAVQRVESTWNEGKPEVYLPLRTYHMRFAYSQGKISGYDESPLGLGVGKGVYDQNGDWRGLYVMGFHDSHFKPEYIAGYAYKTFWHLTDKLRAGVGYTAFLTTRTDIGHYTPIPGILPIVSLEYQKFSVDASYVPGGEGYGNVLFCWGTMRF